MDGYGHSSDDTQDVPPLPGEAAIRTMLDQSRRDAAAGRTVPLQDALARLRAKADRLLAEQASQDSQQHPE